VALEVQPPQEREIVHAVADDSLGGRTGSDGFGVYAGGFGNVSWLVGKGLAGLVGDFLVPRANPAYRIVPAIVPADASFAIHYSPLAMPGADCLSGITIRLQSHKKIASGTHADSPFTYKVVTSNRRSSGTGTEFYARGFGKRQTGLMSIPEDNLSGILEFNACNVCQREALSMPILKNNRHTASIFRIHC